MHVIYPSFRFTNKSVFTNTFFKTALKYEFLPNIGEGHFT